MAKILIVPDVHGRNFWHKAEELIDQVDKVVFLGDYLDPYGHEGITFDMALEEFEKILEFKAKYDDKVILLIGNHDCGYVNTSFAGYSRLNYAKRQDIHELYIKHIDKFQLVYEFENYLFSHSGLYKEWMDKYELSLDDLKLCESFLKDKWKTLQDVSFERGGWDKVGSCVWADIRESLKYKLLEGYHHIVGHTQLESEPYKSDIITCVDVRRCFILNTETKEIIDA